MLQAHEKDITVQMIWWYSIFAHLKGNTGGSIWYLFTINIFAAGLQIYCTWKSGWNQAYFGCLTNCIAPQPIVLESFSNSHKTRQVFKSAINTLMSGLIQAVRKKQLDRTWLCVGISLLLFGLRTWSKCQKTQQVL